MHASAAIQVLPARVSNEEVCRIVDEVIAHIKSKGMKTFVAPFETTIEGDYDEIMEVIKECQKVAIEAGAPEVSTYVKIDYNPHDEGILTIGEKTDKYVNAD